MPDNSHLTIKDWSEEDQPREKLLIQGCQSLSDAELVAILLRSGSRGESALELGRRILADFDNNLFNLGRADIAELMKYKGMGEAKAIALISALELGRRRQHSTADPHQPITSSKDAYNLIAARLKDLPVEEFWVIYTSQAAKPIKVSKISGGGISEILVDTRIIFKEAIQALATGIILVHNHPSGSLKPSQRDIELTQRVKHSANLFHMNLLDHLIIANENYTSFADEGIL